MPFPSTTILPSPVLPTIASAVDAAEPDAAEPDEAGAFAGEEVLFDPIEHPARARIANAEPARVMTILLFTRFLLSESGAHVPPLRTTARALASFTFTAKTQKNSGPRDSQPQPGREGLDLLVDRGPRRARERLRTVGGGHRTVGPSGSS